MVIMFEGEMGNDCFRRIMLVRITGARPVANLSIELRLVVRMRASGSQSTDRTLWPGPFFRGSLWKSKRLLAQPAPPPTPRGCVILWKSMGGGVVPRLDKGGFPAR